MKNRTPSVRRGASPFFISPTLAGASVFFTPLSRGGRGGCLYGVSLSGVLLLYPLAKRPFSTAPQKRGLRLRFKGRGGSRTAPTGTLQIGVKRRPDPPRPFSPEGTGRDLSLRNRFPSPVGKPFIPSRHGANSSPFDTNAPFSVAFDLRRLLRVRKEVLAVSWERIRGFFNSPLQRSCESRSTDE